MISVLEPVEFAGMTLASRIARSATAERLTLRDEAQCEALAAMYLALVRGGVGLIISGHIAVDPSGRVSPNMPGLYREDQIPAWRRVVEAVHAAGGRIAAQLNHGGGRCKPEVIGSGPAAGVFGGPVCVSRAPDREADPLDGAPLDPEGVEILVSRFAAAARRAREAGFDAVQLHGAHGYLVSQFLSPLANRRADEWGGSLEGRARFARRVVQEARRAVGEGFPLGMKLGAVDDPGGGGLTADETVQVARWLETDGLDFIEISGAFHAGVAQRHVRPGRGEAYYAPLARRFREALGIGVIAVGGFRSLAAMNGAVAEGACDLVALSRPLIRQPDLPRILARGGESECLSCNLCLFSRKDPPTRCHSLESRPARGAAPPASAPPA